jgi:hypothetical protein
MQARRIFNFSLQRLRGLLYLLQRQHLNPA